MTSPMIEKAARADSLLNRLARIAETHVQPNTYVGEHGRTYMGLGNHGGEKAVRAILLAIREVDEELEDALQASLDCVPINRCVQQSQQVWRNGIDYVLGT